jgi:hypothetical protein
MKSPFRKKDVDQNVIWEIGISDAIKLRFRILSSMLHSRLSQKLEALERNCRHEARPICVCTAHARTSATQYGFVE